MIDISKAKIAFKKFLDKYEDKSDLSFQLKVIHTYISRRRKFKIYCRKIKSE